MPDKKRVAIIGTAGIPSNYGGFEMLAKQLVCHLDADFDFIVYCSGKSIPKSQRSQTFKNARLKYLPLRANGVQSILYDSLSIFHAVFFADVLFILGVAGAWVLPFIKLFSRKKIIVLVNGIEWKRSRWNILARWYFFWAESKAIKYSHVDILDNESIQDYTALRYGSLSRVVEYGAEHFERMLPGETEAARFPFVNKKYAFLDYDGTGDCKLMTVLEAFQSQRNQLLVIAGDFCKNRKAVSNLHHLADSENIHVEQFPGNSAEYALLKANASIFIHACDTAGTEPGLAEAMHLGIPVLCFNISYNITATECQALYFSDSESLAGILRETSSGEFESIGARLKELAGKRYNWQRITGLYADIFNEALLSNEKVSISPKFTKLPEEKLIEMGLGHLKHQQSFFEKRK